AENRVREGEPEREGKGGALARVRLPRPDLEARLIGRHAQEHKPAVGGKGRDTTSLRVFEERAKPLPGGCLPEQRFGGSVRTLFGLVDAAIRPRTVDTVLRDAVTDRQDGPAVRTDGQTPVPTRRFDRFADGL